MVTPSTTIVTMISASTYWPQKPGDRARDEQDDDEGIAKSWSS
jgi:hypothetical protein